MFHRCSHLWIMLSAFLAGCSTAPESKTSTTTASVPVERQFGVNLASVVDWSSEWPLVDVYRTSRQWMEKGPAPFTYDAAGNPLLRPGQTVESLIFRDLDGHYPAGEYVATFDGTGEVEIDQYDVESVAKPQPGKIVFRVKPANGGILVKVLSSSPRDPIRNIHIWAPGFENAKLAFHPLFLERLKPFQVLRFMDWQRTNNSPLADWSQRPKPGDARYSTDLGVPLEVMIDLANTRQSHPWFCIPHQADDEFIRSFATMVRDRLDPKLKAYVEYSNEVWNWGFGQSAYADQRGKKLKLGVPDHLRFYAKRSCEVFDIFTNVFGNNDRLVRVLGGQFANPRDCEFTLTCDDAFRKADVLAVGAYFGYEYGSPKNVEPTLRLSVEEVLQRCEQEIDGTHRELMRRHVALAKTHNLRLVAYEAGQHLVGHGGAENSKPLEQLMIAANRHPKMASLYRQQAKHWFAEGGSTFVTFNSVGQPSKWGSWGILEYQDQSIQQAPKYRALSEMAGELTGK
jgi:hypothetical protein